MKRFLPKVNAEYLALWKDRAATNPEMANGINTEEALALLSQLKGVQKSEEGGVHVINGTYFKDLHGGQEAVIKKAFHRSAMGESRVYHVTNDIRFEVLAFHLDRFLGTNLVPPVVRLNQDTIAQLKISASPITMKKAARNPANLMDLSHLKILDILLGNVDREMPGNLLSTERGKLVGIDFDLCYPSPWAVPEAVEHHLQIENVLLEPDRKVGKYGATPGIFSRQVLNRLRILDREKILGLAQEGEIELKEKEIESLLLYRQLILQRVEEWKKQYGTEFIEID
ncbi:MAG: hypothetical protein HY400_04240 [Elusimicrobia bacterium]|nr:hypothetical protein [Elusimicrobiota bacterium]